MAIDKTDSQYGILNQSELYGMYNRFITAYHINAVTTADINSGGIIGARLTPQVIVPAHTGFDGWLPSLEGNISQSGSFIIGCLEYDLGSINTATGTFTNGVAMPTKKIRSEGTTYSDQTASMLTMAVVDTALSGTAVSLTVTYTNQDGTGSRTTSTFTFPSGTVAIQSAYNLTPFLQSGDTGIQDITNVTRSGGTSGVIKFYGLIPFAVMSSVASNQITSMSIMNMQSLPMLAESGETISIYKLGLTGAAFFVGKLTLRPI